jgi:phosphoglycolate phosphatase
MPDQTGRWTLLVDLDGTLVDSRAGIIASFRHTLETLGLDAPAPEELGWVIGPPSRTSFPRLGVTPDRLESALTIYRDFYRAGAMHDVVVFEGLPEALRDLKGNGFDLIVATSKPHVFARPILEGCGLAGHFDAIHGAELDGRNDEKAELIGHILAHERRDPRRAIMVGDRRYDVIGSARHAIPCIGVTWGFGSPAELNEAGAAALCDAPPSLPAAVASLFRGRQHKS